MIELICEKALSCIVEESLKNSRSGPRCGWIPKFNSVSEIRRSEDPIWCFTRSYWQTNRQTHNILGEDNKKLRYREQHSTSVVFSWCNLWHLLGDNQQTNSKSTTFT